MYAVLETGGKQYRVTAGDTLEIERLAVEAGPHRVELKAEGFEPVQFEVMITPGETITYKGEMKHR